MSWNPDSTTEDEGLPLWKWDWREIVRRERQAMARARAFPKCAVCGNPMLLGQKGTHHTCR